jgi:predicted ATPase
MITSVAFKNFKALRDTRVSLGPFNLVIGPNGSGKTSLIQALLRLRALAPSAREAAADESFTSTPGAAELSFSFGPPFAQWEVTLACARDGACDRMRLRRVASASAATDVTGVADTAGAWTELRARLASLRAYRFDHEVLARPTYSESGDELGAQGEGLAARLAALHRRAPTAFAELEAGLRELLPEYDGVEFSGEENSFALRPREARAEAVAAEDLSQGTLYLLALLALVHDPAPPALICIEELDRGLHPRILGATRDLLYRLSHPSEGRPACQVIVTTHSPLLLDLFRERPEEVVIAQKTGRAATFVRLSELPHLAEVLAEGGPLGELWYAGILGGVPEEP